MGLDNGLEKDFSEFETEMIHRLFILHLFDISKLISFEQHLTFFTVSNKTKQKHTKGTFLVFII